MPIDRTATPLRPGDFSLYGFESLATPLNEALAQVSVRHGSPARVYVADAIFVPTAEVAPRQFDGALLSADGLPIPLARAERRKSRWGSRVLGSLSRPMRLEPREVIDEEVVYLGWYFDHFGHFLLESLARTWILPELDPRTKVVFHSQRRPTISGALLEILERLGLSRDRILFPEAQTTLRRVIVPEPLYEISHAAHERMTAPFQRIAAQLVTDTTPSDQPLYLSRRLLSSRQRTILGELQLEEVFRENGFLIAYPETMSLTDQIRLVNRHREIFTSAGSGAYMPLFARRPPRLHLLTAGIPFLDYFLAPKAAEIETSLANCFSGGDQIGVHYAPLLVDFARITGYLDQVGLLRRRLRASLAAQSLDLAPAYREAWLYRFLATEARGTELPPDLADEARQIAFSSWPVSWALARHVLSRDPEPVDDLARQFIRLVATETDVGRLAHYHEDISRGIGPISQHCQPETAAQLAAVVRDRFLLDPAAAEERQAERRRARQAARPPRLTNE